MRPSSESFNHGSYHEAHGYSGGTATINTLQVGGSGLYERAARRKPLLKECCIYSIPQAMSETQQTRGRSSSGQMRRKLDLFALDTKRYVCRKPNILHTYLAMSTPSLLGHMVVTAS